MLIQNWLNVVKNLDNINGRYIKLMIMSAGLLLAGADKQERDVLEEETP